MSSSDGASDSKTIWELSPAELEQLKSDVKDYLDGLRVTHLTFTVITTILIWDIMTTWDREAHYVWKARWSFAKFIFLFNRYVGSLMFLVEAIYWFWTPRTLPDCIVVFWLWIGLSVVAGSTASSVLAARLWALYERDRRVLAALIFGFVACFGPGWTLAFLFGTNVVEGNQYRIYGNVATYIGGVTTQEGYDALDWRLKKCYRFNTPEISYSILVGALLYETGIFTALVWKMYKDEKWTRIIEAIYRDGIVYYMVIFCNYAIVLGAGFGGNYLSQAFVASTFYIGIKSMTCSHIILRLRSYFTQGDSIVDGHVETFVFDDANKGEDSTPSSLISTIIQFANMLRTPTGTTFEIRSIHLAQREERSTTDFVGSVAGAEEGRGGDARREQLQFGVPVTSRSPLPSLRPSLDWTSIPTPNGQHSRRGDSTLPTRSDTVVGPSTDPSSPHHARRLRWFSGRLGSPKQPPIEARRNSISFRTSRYSTAAGAWEEPPATIEMDDLTGKARDIEAARSVKGDENRLEQPLEARSSSKSIDVERSGVHHRHPPFLWEGSGE